MSDDTKEGWNVLNKFRKHGKGGGQAPQKVKTNKYEHEGEFGAVRRDQFGVGYWLTTEQLQKLAKLNLEIDDDLAFWDAFKEMRKTEGIKPLLGKREHDYSYDDYGGYSDGYKPSVYTPTKWVDPTKGKSHLSEWWTGFKSWGGSGDETKLALALKAVQTVINVIDDSDAKVRMRVSYAQKEQDPVNYTNFKSNEVVVSPKPILDGKLSDGDAIDIITGEGLHEGSHAKYSRKIIGTVENDPRIDPLVVSALLVNILEDFRIERETSLEFPGFEPYFEKLLAWMWDSRKHVERKYGPDLESKLNTMIGYCRWQDKYPEPEHAVELAWWTDWRDRYAKDGSNARDLAIEGIEHLRLPTPDEQAKGKTSEDSQASQDLDKQTENEEKMRQAAATLDQMIREFMDRMKGLEGACTHTDPDQSDSHDSVDEDTAVLIQRRLDEEIEQERTPVPANGAFNPPMIITKPLETARSIDMGKQPAGPGVKKYRRALLLRPAKPTHSVKLTKDGKVDPTQLWRWAGDDWRVFQKREIITTPSARIYLLVDMSGSMGGAKLEAARQIATLFTTALTSIDGVTPKVFGHTGDMDEIQSEVYRIWEPGDSLRRLGLINAMQHGNNYDGHAIAYVAKVLEQDAQPGEQRIIIVLSDGLPSGHGYGSDEGMAHVRKVVSYAEKRQIRVLQIAIDSSLNKARQDAMFDEYIPFKPGDGLDEIPRRLTKWLTKIL